MSFDKLIGTLEGYFGYPLRRFDTLMAAMRAYDDIHEISYEDKLAELLCDNIVWNVEDHDGMPPRQYRHVDDLVDPAREILARHFSGLFHFTCHWNDIVRDHLMCGLMSQREVAMPGNFCADLNPRTDSLVAPVYYAGPSGMPRWYLFETPPHAYDFEDRLDGLERAQPGERERLMHALIDTYPRASCWFVRNLAEYGASELGLAGDFPDKGGARLFAAYDAFLPIARVLVLRCRGRVTVLPSAEAAACLRVAAADPAYTPNVLLRLLALAVSGDMRGARDAAQNILDTNAGVALTQRWARRVLSGAAILDEVAADG